MYQEYPQLSFVKRSFNFNIVLVALLLVKVVVVVISTTAVAIYLDFNFKKNVQVVDPSPNLKQNVTHFKYKIRTKNCDKTNHTDGFSSTSKTTTTSMTEAEKKYDQDQNEGNKGSYNYLYPKPWTLIDIKIRYLLNAPICSSKPESKSKSLSLPELYEDQKQWKSSSVDENENEIVLIILITSHASHFRLRKELRQIMPTKELQRIGMRRAFLLAKTFQNENATMFEVKHGKEPHVDFQQLKKEQEKHADLIVGSFRDSYKNLTYKNLMGLEWVTRYCSQTQYILKQDDDIYVDYYQLAHILRPRSGSESTNSSVESQAPELFKLVNQIRPQEINDTLNSRIFVGGMTMGGHVIRDNNSKWFVSEEEHPNNKYKPFASGWSYFTNPHTVEGLLAVSSANMSTYFWVDDAHITGALREKANIDLVNLSELFTIQRNELLCCLNPLNTGEMGIDKSNPTKPRGKPYWCHFIVGPPLPYLNEKVQLHQHSKFCYFSQSCLRRDGHFNREFCWKDKDNNTNTITINASV